MEKLGWIKLRFYSGRQIWRHSTLKKKTKLLSLVYIFLTTNTLRSNKNWTLKPKQFKSCSMMGNIAAGCWTRSSIMNTWEEKACISICIHKSERHQKFQNQFIADCAQCMSTFFLLQTECPIDIFDMLHCAALALPFQCLLSDRNLIPDCFLELKK